MTTPAKSAKFTKQLAAYREEIDAALDNFFKSQAASEILARTKHGPQSFEMLRQFALRPGKRLRGALAIFTYESLSGQQNPSIINAALAMELVQDYLLIIDDVMDRSDLRRGQPTIHELIKKELGPDEHHANMLAINIGLLASHMAQSVLLEVTESAERLVAASKVLQENIAITAYGQIDDLYNDLQASAGEDEIINLYQRKNSYYSFVSPMLLGAALAGRSDTVSASQIAAIGLPAGVAFQLQDDILGLFGDESVTGKSSSDDLREGKFTLLVMYALEKAGAKDAARIRRALGNPGLTKAEAREVRTIIERCGALEKTRQRAQDFCVRSKEAVTSSTIFDEPNKQFLLQLIEFVVNRKV